MLDFLIIVGLAALFMRWLSSLVFEPKWGQHPTWKSLAKPRDKSAQGEDEWRLRALFLSGQYTLLKKLGPGKYGLTREPNWVRPRIYLVVEYGPDQVRIYWIDTFFHRQGDMVTLLELL